MKKAIITFGVGYGFDDLKYFIHSCSIYAPDADIYMFVGANIEALKKQCLPYSRVHLVLYHEKLVPKIISKVLMKFPGISGAYPRLLRKLYQRRIISKSLLNAFATPLVQFMVKRFFIIQRFLKTIPHTQIMLTDVRDVLLQADPFQNIGKKSIITGIEPVTNEQKKLNLNKFIPYPAPQPDILLHATDTIPGTPSGFS